MEDLKSRRYLTLINLNMKIHVAITMDSIVLGDRLLPEALCCKWGALIWGALVSALTITILQSISQSPL